MTQFNSLRRAMISRLCAALALFLFAGTQFLPAQTGSFSYGKSTTREGGSVVCTNRINGNLLIAGYRNDSTLIIEIDQNGNLLREVTFKVTAAGHEDWVTDFKFDAGGVNLMVGTGVDAIVGVPRYGGYVFRFDPVAFLPIWTTLIPNDGNPDFAIYSVHDLGGANYRLYGSTYTNANGAVGVISKAAGTFTGVVDFNLTNAEDFSASEIAPGGTDVVATGRWGHTAAVTQYRPGLARLTGTTLSGSRTFLRPAGLGNNARLYSLDVTFAPGNDRPVTVGGGDFGGGSAVNTEIFWTRHDLTTCAQLTGFRMLVPGINTQFAHEVIPVVTSAANVPDWAILGQGVSTTTPGLRRVFLLQITDAGAFNWGNFYGDVNNTNEHYFLHHLSQQQLIRHNSPTGTPYLVFTGTRVDAVTNSEEMWVTIANLNGTMDAGDDAENGPCLESFTLTPAAQVANNNPVLTSNTIAMPYTASPWVANDPNLDDEVVCGATCFAATDSNYIHVNGVPGVTVTYNSGNTPSGTAVWAGKIYVDADIIVDGVTLDITNTDVVFETCTGITLINGGNLRANNSTLRPCNEDESWRGVTFNDTSSGVINECVFKNAYEAVRFNASTFNPYDVRLTNNLFVNCLNGVSMPQAGGLTLSEGITGNTFTVDDRNILWFDDLCNPLANQINYFGIDAASTQFNGQVSQNDFVNTSEGTRNLTGIFWSRCSGKISLNHFTNNRTAVHLADCNKVAVENNQTELTQLYTTYTNQILAQGGGTIWILGNELTNSTETNTCSLAGAAIYLEKIATVNVKENTVNGFCTGIFCRDGSFVNVALNKISQANVVGIHFRNGLNNIISCNEIKMRLRPNNAPTCIGIHYQHSTATAPSLIIKSNCVYDASLAMYLVNTIGTQTIPVIHNNYLYNYTLYGIYVDQFTGNIGTALTPPEQAGRNTFVSNNILGAAVDIFTVGPVINSWGNFGLSTISANVNMFGTGLYNSITGCGSQIGTISSTLTQAELCDTFTGNMDGTFLKVMNGVYIDFAAANPSMNRNSLALSIVKRLIAEGKADKATAFNTWIQNQPHFTAAEKALSQYNLLAGTHDYAGAISQLSALTAADAAYMDYAAVEEIQHNLALAGRAYPSLTLAERAALEQIDNARGEFADHARDVLHKGTHLHPAILDAVELPEFNHANNRVIKVDEAGMKLFPNPAQTSVTIEFSVLSAGASLRVFDATGRLVTEAGLEADAASISLDLTGWKPGIYLVSLTDAAGTTQTAKLLVQ